MKNVKIKNASSLLAIEKQVAGIFDPFLDPQYKDYNLEELE